MSKISRDIPNTLEISGYMHCGFCLDEMPDDISPRDFAQLEVGWTVLGLQVWCKRHECNVCHVDFQDVKHPVNISTNSKKDNYCVKRIRQTSI